MRWIDPGRSADCVHGVAVWLATLAVLVLSYGTHESCVLLQFIFRHRCIV
jgi:hypothetical protein